MVSVRGSRLEVGTKGGTVAVTLTPETKFEQGEGGAHAGGGRLLRAVLRDLVEQLVEQQGQNARRREQEAAVKALKLPPVS